MNNLFQLRNKLSNRILTDSQQKNTKGRGKGLERLASYDIDSTPPPPTTPNPPTSGTSSSSSKSFIRTKFLGGSPGGGPPQFGPGNSFNQII